MFPIHTSRPNLPARSQIYDVISTQTPVPFPGHNTDTSTYKQGIATNIAGADVDRWYRYASFTAEQDPSYKSLFSPQSCIEISNQITKRLRGVHPQGKNIAVPDETILSVLDSYWNNAKYYDPVLIKQQTISYIVEQIKLEFQQESQNANYNIWNQYFTPDLGLQQFPQPKLNERRHNPYWAWNY